MTGPGPSDARRLDDDAVERGMAAAFGGETRAAGALAGLGTGASKVFLREPASDPPSPILTPVEDRRAGRYQVLGEIARGGVGVVLKGHDNDLGRDVAMKLLREEHAKNPDVIQRFIEEAQIGGQLQHPGIVPVYELGLREDKRPYFAMKLVKGRTLAALLSERKDLAQDRRRFVGVFEQVCQTMAYAHSRGVVHRDLKPSNVMVGAFGEVQVVDWGLAKVLRQGGVDDERRAKSAPDVSVIATVRTGSVGSESVVGSVLGTPAYMPPEQARGRVDELDERTDVFSLGAVLCEILTGKPPYVGDGREVLLAAAMAKLDDAHARLDVCGADQELVALARSCLLPAREVRPADAAAVARSVTSYLASIEERVRAAQIQAAEAHARGEEAVATAAVERERRRQEQRARRMTVALAAVVLASVVAGGLAWRGAERTRLDREHHADTALATALEEAQFLHRRATEGQDLRLWDDAESAAKRGDVASQDSASPEAAKARFDAFRRALDDDLANVRSAVAADALAAERSRAGDVAGAMTAIDEAARRLPRHAAFHARRSALFVRKAQWRSAQREARTAVDLDPSDAVAWSRLCIAALEHKDFEEARRAGLEQTRRQPDDARAYINLGSAHGGMGDWDAARRACEDSLACWPGFPSALTNLRFYERLKTTEADVARRLRGDELTTADDWLATGRFLVHDFGRFADAVACFEKWMTLDPAAAERVWEGDRYDAACSAARAGAGEGRVAAALDDRARGELRAKARKWLAADLAEWRRLLDGAGGVAPTGIVESLAWWREDGDLAPIRDEEFAAKMSDEERKACAALWADVDALLARARAAAPK
jgi:tetratricopeptide (TPR) repeat protein/tRNA A-37 threonylcarbamoyl transferase component Bud32